MLCALPLLSSVTAVAFGGQSTTIEYLGGEIVSHHRPLGALGVAVLLATTSARAYAQDTAPAQSSTAEPASSSSASEGVPDIVVFGQRHALGESAQKVPISITAVDQRLLQATNSVSIQDIGALAPGVQTTPVGTFPGFPNFSIRGIGIGSSIRSVDPAINIVQDGMVLAYQAGAIVPTFDLESVEILRGPQGVLFGRNATGGALVLRTRRPSDQFGLRFDLSYGNFNEVNANASVEGPLGTSNILGKVAILYRSSTGDIRNTNEGVFVPSLANPTGAPSNHGTGHVGDISEITIKPTFLFKISDGTKLTLFTQYEHFNDDGSTPRNFAPPPGLATTQSATDYGYTPTTKGYDTNLGDPGYLRLREGHVIAELTNDIGPGVLTTVAGWRHVIYDSTTNLAGTPYTGFVLPDNVEHATEWSLESRYNVTLFKGLELTSGVYLMRSDISVTERRDTAGPVGNPLSERFIQGTFFQRTDAIAGFANLDWSISDTLKISAGGRYSTEKKRIDYTPLAACTNGSFVTCGQTPLNSAKRWNNFSPRAVITWTPADHILLFASYTQGFRSGNYNPRTNDTTGLGVGPADPETVKAYELGAKTDLFDRKVRLNVSVYQSDYHNIQEVLTAPGVAIIQTLLNAANARMRGIDGELTIKPVRAFELNTNVGYIDAKYRSFDVPVPGVTDPTSLPLPKIPKWTVYVAGTYNRDIPGLDGNLALRVSYDWRSHFSTDFPNTPGLGQKAYGLTNANLTFSRQNWSVSLYGRNLFNVVYAETKARNFAWVAYGGQPRTYGVRLTWKM
jgi:iron complex outermembrane receptor protein